MGSGDMATLDDVFTEDFLDHVSGRTGRGIWGVVTAWSRESFADQRLELHAIMTSGDLVSVWFTMSGRHIGNGFPFLSGRPVTGRTVNWQHVHLFRCADGRFAEHWAVRDDLSLLHQIDAPTHSATEPPA
jgi:predicted ester cyclase